MTKRMLKYKLNNALKRSRLFSTNSTSRMKIMTLEQDHLITLLRIKYGDIDVVTGMWLYNDPELSPEELAAVDAWLNSDEKEVDILG